MDHKHIGVFDSGQGGAITTKYLQQQFPDWKFTFIDDQAHAPYGSKTPEQLLTLAQNMVARLEKQNVDEIVVACHTICSNIFPQLDEWSSLPLWSVNHTLALSLKKTDPGNILLLATTATIKSGWWQSYIQNNLGQTKTWFRDCPGLATAIDQSNQQQITAEINNCAANLPHNEIDTVALACTHYPAVSSQIQAVFPTAQIVDARYELASLLRKK